MATGAWPATLVLPVGLVLPTDDEQRVQRINEIGAPHGLADLIELKLTKLPELRNIHLEFVGRACTQLQCLDLTDCASAVDDDGLELLAELSNLRSLCLANCHGVTDAGIIALAQGPAVESWEVRNGMRSRGLYATLGAAMGGDQRGMRQLVALDLSGVLHLTDAGLTQLADGCPNLVLLSLSGCVAIRDRGLLAVARNERLEALTLDGCEHVSDTALSTLSRQCPLHTLSLAGGVKGVNAFAIRAIAEGRGETLVTLDLSSSPRLDADACLLALIGRCPRLRVLRLNRCERLSDTGLLEHLFASSSSSDDDAPPQGLPSLEVLELDGCPLVSDAARARVRASLQQGRA